jgi:hypothetical protein
VDFYPQVFVQIRTPGLGREQQTQSCFRLVKVKLVVVRAEAVEVIVAERASVLRERQKRNTNGGEY